MKDRAIVLFNVVAFGYLYLSTELLSAANAISKNTIRITWGVFLFCGVIVLCVLREKLNESVQGLMGKGKSIRKYVVLATALIIFALVMAFFIAPCNYDSMTYHLPRVMHWVQNKSVDYYFTNIPRQLFSQPFAEYAVLHMYLLVGNDQCVNLVQWYAYFFSAVLIFLILRKSDIDEKVACVSALMAMSAPIIVAESVTTQNDIFAGIWPLMYLYFALEFSSDKSMVLDRKTAINLVAMGCVAGLGYLSKAQSAIPIAIISIWILIVRIRNKDKLKYILIDVVTIVCIAMVLALPYFVRNYVSVGDIFAASEFSFLSIDTIDPRGWILNFYKNWCMGAKSYMNLPVDRALYYSGIVLANALRFPLEDSSITYASSSYTNWQTQFKLLPEYNMDTATAPIINWMFLICCVISVVRIRKSSKYQSIRRVLFLSIFLIMSYIKWQPWITRLIVPAYLLMVVYEAYVMNDVINSYDLRLLYTKVLPMLLVFTVVPALYNNLCLFLDSIDSDSRFQNMFVYKADSDYWAYSDLMSYSVGLSSGDFGLMTYANGFEYPMWTMLKRPDNRIDHVSIEEKEYAEWPEHLIKIECGENQIDDILSLGDVDYICTYLGLGNPQYSLWEKSE